MPQRLPAERADSGVDEKPRIVPAPWRRVRSRRASIWRKRFDGFHWMAPAKSYQLDLHTYPESGSVAGWEVFRYTNQLGTLLTRQDLGTAGIAPQSVDPFFDDDRDHRQRRYRVGPPPAP